MKVLILANAENTIVHFRLEILDALVQAGHEVLVAYPLGEHTQAVMDLGCRVVNMPLNRHGTNVFHDLGIWNHCWQLIRQHHPNLVLTYTVKPNIYGSFAAWMQGVPYINNITGLGSALQKIGPLAKLILFLQKMAYRHTSCIFFQNQENCRRLRTWGVINEHTPVQILPGSGVNLKDHAYVPYPEEEDGKVRFVIVARIRADKGYREFLAAVERLKAKYPATEFHVIGWYQEESFRNEIERLVVAGVLVYHGELLQSQVHQVVGQCHCLVHPSYHEGMANVLLEAAAAGRPVIASDIPGCREAFEEGVTGFGCRVQDVESLYKVMEKFLLLPHEEKCKMGMLGRQKMEQEFDRKIVIQKYLDEIRKKA